MTETREKNGESRSGVCSQQLSLDFSAKKQSAKILPFAGNSSPNADVVALRKLLEAAKRLPR
jgi:hypothetical protein